MKVGLIVNLGKPRALSVSGELAAWLDRQGVEVLLAPELAYELPRPGPALTLEELAAQADFILVLGGDGTLLAAAKRVVAQSPLLLGVNLGHLGFLTEIEEANLYRDLPAFLSGRYIVDERVMLRATVLPGSLEYVALNDVVVTKGPLARTLHLRTLVDGVHLSSYTGDGLIVSTPTGSTAYSLAAGGPVLTPNLAALVVTPICAHTFYSRPTVISASERLRVELLGQPGETMLTLDGQEGRPLLPGEAVEVSLSRHVTRLMRRPGWSFYEVLRRKLAEPDAGEGLE